MSRRTLVLAVTMMALVFGALFSSFPASASSPRDVSPASIDPRSLALPASALPPAPIMDHMGVSDNADADGKTTPPDGFKSQTRIIHSKDYEGLGRITGYREDFRYTLPGNVAAGTEYQASIYPSAAAAHTAYIDATSKENFAILTVIASPLPDAEQCHAGDYCIAYAGPNPGSPNTVVFVLFARGPILVEAAAQVPNDKFAQVKLDLEAALYTMMNAADVQIKRALNPQAEATETFTPVVATVTATSTATPTPTDTPTAVPTKKPTKPCPKNSSKKKGKCTCKKGYVKKKGKCVKKKKK